MVIKLYKQQVSPKEIAKQLHMSLRTVYKILNKEFGEKQTVELNDELKAIKLFRLGKKPVEVTMKLGISTEETIRYYIKFKELFYLGKFGEDYKYIQGYMPQLRQICKVMKEAGLNIKEVVDEYNNYLNSTRDLAEMQKLQLDLFRSIETLKRDNDALESEKGNLESRIKSLKPEVEELERRYSLTYDCLTYQNPNTGYNYNYNQNQFAGYYQNYNRYWQG